MDDDFAEHADDGMQVNILDSDEQWLLLNAIRQAAGIGNKSTITYAAAAEITRQIARGYFGPQSQLLEAYEAETARLYRARAAARAQSPETLLDADLGQLREEVRNVEGGNQAAIESQIRRLERSRDVLTVDRWEEGEAIISDADRRDIPFSAKGKGYRDYRLPKNRTLRIRVLHTTVAESQTGVDLLYETYYAQRASGGKTNLLARIVVLQYKMWDGKRLYTSLAPSLLQQLDKMTKVFCGMGLCEAPEQADRYRLPHCCAFLRLTDRTQSRGGTSKVTHAWHVPVCQACTKFTDTDSGHKVLRSEMLSNSSVTQDPFEELYNRSMLGSRLISSDRLEQFYSSAKILSDIERVTVHAQEF